MTKTYRLTYEPVEIMHALFDRTTATQGWRISARMLREYIEYFASRTEQLDLLAQEGKAIFTSFTEKIQDGKGTHAGCSSWVGADRCKEVLKQPLETAISIHTEDFEDFHMQENMHIVISVKDFKAIVTHAETLRVPISAHFSYPTRPLQFSYQNSGVHCEFTLMTTGDYRGASATPNPNFITTRSSSRQPSVVPPAPSRTTSEMPPPPRPLVKPLSSQSNRSALGQGRQKSIPEPAPDDAEDSLFLPQGDDDPTWDPPNYEPEGEEMLGWDASNDNAAASFHPTFRDSGSAAKPKQQEAAQAAASQEGLEPTQRLSQVRSSNVVDCVVLIQSRSCMACSIE